MQQTRRRQTLLAVAMGVWFIMVLRSQLLVLLPERVACWLRPTGCTFETPVPAGGYAALACLVGAGMLGVWWVCRRLGAWWTSPVHSAHRQAIGRGLPTAHRLSEAARGTQWARQLGLALPLLMGWAAAMGLAASQGWLGRPASLDAALAALPLWVVGSVLFIDALRRGGPGWTMALLVLAAAGGCVGLLYWVLFAPWWTQPW